MKEDEGGGDRRSVFSPAGFLGEYVASEVLRETYSKDLEGVEGGLDAVLLHIVTYTSYLCELITFSINLYNQH